MCVKASVIDPFGAAPMLPPPSFNHNLLGQGAGAADHLTLLRLFKVQLVACQGPVIYRERFQRCTLVGICIEEEKS